MAALAKDKGGPCSADYLRSLVAEFNYPLEKTSDMNEEMRMECREMVVNALEKSGENYDQASRSVKEQMDKKYGPSWHCVIGEGFGFEITYELKHMIHMYHKGYLSIVVFKSL